MASARARGEGGEMGRAPGPWGIAVCALVLAIGLACGVVALSALHSASTRPPAMEGPGPPSVAAKAALVAKRQPGVAAAREIGTPPRADGWVAFTRRGHLVVLDLRDGRERAYPDRGTVRLPTFVGDGRVVVAQGGRAWEVGAGSEEWVDLTGEGAEVISLGYDMVAAELEFVRSAARPGEHSRDRWQGYRMSINGRPRATGEPEGPAITGFGDRPGWRRIRFAPDGRAVLWPAFATGLDFPYEIGWRPEPAIDTQTTLIERGLHTASDADWGYGTLYLLRRELVRARLPRLDDATRVGRLRAGWWAQVAISEPLGVAIVSDPEPETDHPALLLVELSSGRLSRLGEGESPDIWPRAWPAGHQPQTR